jgi:hypothetical protein
MLNVNVVQKLNVSSAPNAMQFLEMLEQRRFSLLILTLSSALFFVADLFGDPQSASSVQATYDMFFRMVQSLF